MASPQGYFNAPGLSSGQQTPTPNASNYFNAPGILPASQGGPIQRQTGGMGLPGSLVGQAAGVGTPSFNAANPNQQPMASMPGLQQATTPQTGGFDGSNPLSRIESYFGPLGTPTTALQQQSLGGISQFLNSNPYGQSNQALQNIQGGQGYNESNQAFRDVGNQNYFGGAQGAFNQLGQGGQYSGAENIFNQLANFNPFGSAQASLEGQLSTNPGQGVMDALKPTYDRALAQANQTGGRFGSSNAILNSRALQDYNLLNAQALQQGVSQQQNAASILGQIGNSLIGAKQGAGQGLLGVGQGNSQNQTNAANGLLGVGQGQLQQGLGSAQGLSTNAQALGNQQLNAAGQMANNQNSLFNNYQGAYGTGSAQAQQEAQRQQQALQILLGQLGVSQQATLQTPTQVNPTGGQQGAGLGGMFGQLLSMLGGGGGGGGVGQQSPPPYQTPGGFGIPYGF